MIGNAYKFALLPLPFCIAAPVVAQDTAQTFGREIVVTGEGLAADAGEAAYAVDKVAPADDARPALRLEQLIAALPGAQAFRRADTRSSHPTANGLTTRALGGNAASRTLVLLDGVPMADPFGGWVAWNRVDAASLGRASLQRGGVIGLGSGALAGVLQLDSGGADGVDGALSYGGRDSRSASVLAGGGLSGASVMLSARHDAGDGFAPIVAGQRGVADGAAPYSSGSARVRLVVPAGSGALQFGAGGWVDDRNRGLAFTDNRSESAGASVRYVRQSDRDIWGVEALAFAQMVGFDSGFASVDATRAVASPTLDQRVSATGWGARVTLQPPAIGALSLRFGGHIGGQEGVTREGFTFVSGAPTRDRRAGGRNGQVGLFGGGDVALSPAASLNIGVGGEWLSQSEGQLTERVIATGAVLQDQRPSDRSRFALTGRVGVAVRPSAALTLRAAGYSQVRQPTLNELYRPFRVGLDGVAANPNLSPERMYGAEIGADLVKDFGAGEGFSASITGYVARLDNAIANVAVVRTGFDCPGVGFVRGTCFARQNLPAIESVGVEGSMRFTHGPLTAQAALAYGDARVKGGALDGFTPAQTPKWSGSARVSVAATPALSFHGGAQWQSARFEDDRETVPLPGFIAFDAGVEWRVSKRFSIALDAENLTNENIITGSSGGVLERATPRTIWVTLRIE